MERARRAPCPNLLPRAGRKNHDSGSSGPEIARTCPDDAGLRRGSALSSARSATFLVPSPGDKVRPPAGPRCSGLRMSARGASCPPQPAPL
eukprot:1171558-Pyramimonas_sp.AAC.1